MNIKSIKKSLLISFSFTWKKTLCFCIGTALASVLSLEPVSAQVNRTWIGTISEDWYNPTNWSPNGVPAANDIVNVTNGTVNLSAPVVISNQFNWSGMTLMGDALTIASNAVLNINASSTVYLQNALTNAGTVNWTNTGSLIVENGGGAFGLVVNLPGALWNIENDQIMVNNQLGNAYFQNQGTLQKSASTGTTTIYISVLNSGSVTAVQGTLSLFGGGLLAGNFTAGAGATLDFASGGFTNSGPVSINGPGPVQFTGGTLTLLTDTISNLALTGGTVDLGPAFQGGTITNLTIDGATLAGTNLVTGVFNRNNGYVAGGPLTIATNGILNINGTTTLYLQSALTNAGTVNWTNTGALIVQNGGGTSGLIVNLPGATWNIENDQIMENNQIGNPYFQNAGTLKKLAGTGTTYIYIPVINSGSVTAVQGTLNFFGGGLLAGSFTAGSGATLDFGNGGFTNSGPVSINGPGAIQLTGGTLTLLSDAITNLALTGGTVDLGPAFQGGTITNLTIDGATLAGTNLVTGVFNWNNGTIVGGPLTIASNAVLNINGTTTLTLESALTNAGTVIWTNTGALNVENGGGASGLVVNLPGALWKVENDQTLENSQLGNAYFQNAGTLQKSAGTGTTFIYIPLLNTGSVTALEGTLSFYGGGTLAGSFTADSGAAIDFVLGSYTNSGPVSVNGPGAVQLTGGTLTLLTDAIPNLGLNGGTVDLGPAFQGGVITNLTINGATLAGTNLVTGVFNWNNGAIAGGPITIASNAVLNINGTTTLTLENALTNAGTVIWTNVGSLNVQNNGGSLSGLIVNLPGALWNIENNQSMFDNFSGNPYFQNAGTLQKSAGTATTFIYIPTTNSGVISALKGNITFANSSFVPNGGEMLFGLSNSNSYGTVSITPNATLGGTVGVVYENGFVPASGNSFTVLTYGSYSGIFTNVNFPAGPIWVTNYGPTSFTILATSINKLAFTTEPVGNVLTNVTLAPVVVQIEDPNNNPVPVSGIPITLVLNGSGTLNGTVTQNTDATGKATYADLSITAAGTKTLRATYAELTTAVSVPFQILPLRSVQLSHAGFLIQLNGNHTLDPTSIYASTNLYTWLLVYTNGPTNGPIVFLDTSATNYPHRFYQILEP